MTMPDVSGLPENLDATYSDDPDNPGRKAHQQHHDTVHAAVKALLPRTEASATYATKTELADAGGVDVPAGAFLVLATEDSAVADANPQYAWLILEPTGDTTDPSVPTNLTATPGNGQVSLTWTASTDDTGVTGYRVYRDGVLATSPSGTSSIVSSLTNGTSYAFTVSAVDAAGNESAQSAAVNATPAAPAAANIAQVQKVAGNVGSAATLTVTLPAAPTSGNKLIAFFHGTTTQANINTPAGWTKITTAGDSSGSLATFVKEVSGDAAAVTFTTGIAAALSLEVFEYSGLADSDASVVDVSDSVIFTPGVTTTVGPVTTTAADTLLLAGFGLNGAGGNFTNTWTNGFVNQNTTNGRSRVGALIVSAAGTYETATSWELSRSGAKAMLALKAAA